MSSPERQKYYICAAAGFFGFLIIAALLAFFAAPRIAQEKITKGFSSAGFDTAHLQKPQIKYGAMLYKDVAFDKDNFTTIKFIKVTYNPFMLLLTGRMDTLDVIGLNMTGDWSNQQLTSLSFAGWQLPSDLSRVPFSSFRHINISKSRVSLLTQTAGGISIFFDVSGNRKGNQLEFQSSIKSEQKYLTLIATGNGVVEGPRWYMDTEIIDGKFEDPSGDIKASRVSGWFNLAKTDDAPVKIMSQLRAGGINLYDLPWQNASATLDFTNYDTKLFVEAKSVGYDGLELELNVFKKGAAAPAYGGMLHADTGAVFFDYFKGRTAYKNLLLNLEGFRKAEDINVSFAMQEKARGKSIVYELKQGETPLGKTGEITADHP